MAAGEDRSDLEAEVAQLRKELAKRERLLRQVRREARVAEELAVRGKRSMLVAQQRLETGLAEQRRISRDLEEARQQAEAAMEARGRFLAVVSHELRTPLNGILGTLELLRESGLDEEQGELSALAHSSAESLHTIIDDVLDFSKAEAGKLELESVPFDLRGCVHAVVALQAAAAVQQGLELEVEVEPAIPECVQGDPLRLRQVLLNLLTNALKFTPRGSVTLRVRASGLARDAVRFEVTDTGVGIAPGALANIFCAFSQEDSSTARRFGGTGLGLSICQHLVGLMEGELEVESQPGRGSTFAFEARLPEVLVDPSVAAGQDAREAVPEAAEGLRVLVVDDNAVNRMVAERMLKKLGAAVTLASGGAEAIETVGRETFELVLMDCSMPSVDGFEATRAIRTLEGPEGRMKILALTALAADSDEERCLEAGMDGFLTKPTSLDALRQALLQVRSDPQAAA